MVNKQFSTLPTATLDALTIGDSVSVIDLRPITEVPVHTGSLVDRFTLEHYNPFTQTTLTHPKVVIESRWYRVEYFASDIGLCPDPHKYYSPHVFTVREGDEPDIALRSELARMKLQLPYRTPVMQWSVVRT